MIFIQILGAIQSIKKSILVRLEALDKINYDQNAFLPHEVVTEIAEISSILNREIAIFIDRKGKIVYLGIGDSKSVSLPNMDERRSMQRLCGFRCIHTHPNSESTLSEVDLHSLLELRLDAMVAVGLSKDTIVSVHAAFPTMPFLDSYTIIGPCLIEEQTLQDYFELILKEDKAEGRVVSTEIQEEKAILVGISSDKQTKEEGERLLVELEELAKTAGAKVVHKVLQNRERRDAAYYIGRGKLQELALARQALKANLFIFDDELSGAQIRNIEEVVGVKVIDRTSLILDIFASRAGSREGKLQVELAQLKYRIPRLGGMGIQLSRLGGGIGTRGPGEKKLEIDKRHIRKKINYIEQELKDVRRKRDVLRKGRREQQTPVVALVGYTNAGKSSLMNAICEAEVYVENQLFATLDPTARGFTLQDGRLAMMVDTVGFIRKLPHDLIDAFKSTLEEVILADVLLHVVDVSSSEAEEQILVVNEILKELDIYHKPTVIAYNKCDKVELNREMYRAVSGLNAVQISAKTKQGLDSLSKMLADILPKRNKKIKLFVPYSHGWVVAYIREHGTIDSQMYEETGVVIEGSILVSKEFKIKEFCRI